MGSFIGGRPAPPRKARQGRMASSQVHVKLADDTTVLLRKASEADGSHLDALFKEVLAENTGRGLSPAAKSRMRERVLQDEKELNLVAEKRDGSLVALASYRVTGPDIAELAMFVSAPHRGKGLGTAMLRRLARFAEASKVREFEMTVGASDYEALDRIKGMGFPVRFKIIPGKIRIVMLTSATQAPLAAFEQHDASATVDTIKHFFRPRSIAVIGASREKGTIGGDLFKNLLEADFNGPVYPVNTNSSVVQSVAAYDSVLKCPGPVDLAFIVVPARAVTQVARECAQKGVRALVVITAGFAESGREGAVLQEELVSICRGAGMRMIGPNCMGIINTDPAVRLNGQFSPYLAIPGRIGFWSQSGGLGVAVIDLADKLGVGLSEFVSAGNRADVSGNDILHYWENNDNVDVMLLYIESFGDSRRFARLAKRVTRKKPIVAVKSGRSTAGFRSTQSHTGALLAASDVTVDALFKQSGVIRTDSLDEMFDVAALLATQPVPQGDRVAILSNAGGAAVLAADACESAGLKVPEFSETTQHRLRSFLNPMASTGNPVDMSGAATPSDYAHGIRAIAADPEIDSLMVIFIPPLAQYPELVASEILGAVKKLRRKLPIVSTFMATKGVTRQLSDGKVRVPSYPFPELAVQALSRVTEYGKWLRSPPGVRPSFSVKTSEAASIVARSMGSADDWMRPADMDAFLKCYGIMSVKSVQVKEAKEVGLAAREFSGKVVVKAIAPGLLHKSDVGAVRIGIDASEAERNAQAMSKHLVRKGFAPTGFLVEEMVSDAVEMFVGVTHDPTFGPLLACGAGGTLVELVKDVSVGLTPLTKQDANRMVHTLKTFQVLTGYRGGPRYDVEALVETILRLAQMVEDFPEVAELDLNPLMVLRSGKGAVVVDSRIRVAESSPYPTSKNLR